MSKISGDVNHSVTLGSAGYAGPLTITSTGTIAPIANGAIGLVLPSGASSAIITNYGLITAGSGAAGQEQAGGIGIAVMEAATIFNDGRVFGGAGGYGTGSHGSGPGGDGIYFQVAGASLINRGQITGGAGGGNQKYIGEVGGYGVAAQKAFATITNDGGIFGGVGGASTQQGGVGGEGVRLYLDGTLTNNGSIFGGAGGYGKANAGQGSAGVYGLNAYGKNAEAMSNNGYIRGGDGGAGSVRGGNGGDGADPIGSDFANTGTIVGGGGSYNVKYGGSGGIGVAVLDNGPDGSSNAGLIRGGAGGSGEYCYVPGAGGEGLVLVSRGAFVNSGTIIGGAGGYYTLDSRHKSGSGGTGARVDDSTLTNHGVIQGGATGSYRYGATGLIFSVGSINNTGLIAGGDGGYGGYSGGNGVGLSYGGVLTNSGVIMGGAGGYSPFNDTGPSGGVGVLIYGNSTTSFYVLNTGTIIGGVGARASQLDEGSPPQYGGAGGFGVEITQGTFVNRGTITGGAGGYGAGKYSGVGGVGFGLDGGTLVNAGKISGGGNGAVAVYLGSGAATLVIETGARFSGKVLANPSTDDVLEFSGKSSTMFSGIGTQIVYFQTIDFASGAKWKISGDIAGLATGQEINGFVAGDKIKLTNAAAASGVVAVRKAGVVTITITTAAGNKTYALDIAGAKLGATNYKFSGHTLTESKTRTAMDFIAPHAAAPAWTATILPELNGWLFAHRPANSLVAALQGGGGHLTNWRGMAGGGHDLMMSPHRGVETIVTLQAG